MPALADDVWGAGLAGALAALLESDAADPDPAPGAAGVAGEALDDGEVGGELLWLVAAGAVAFELALAGLVVGESMFVCSNDEKLCDGALADAELAGGAEFGPDIISRIAGVMKRAART